jgi:hypothetical protein
VIRRLIFGNPCGQALVFPDSLLDPLAFDQLACYFANLKDCFALVNLSDL